MEALYRWVGNILSFLIFMSMLENLLPSKKYEKYIRFFAGMVLILLVIQPLTGPLRLEERIAYYFEAISFQRDSQDLKKEILGIEKERLARVIRSYEEGVEQDVQRMVVEAGLEAGQVHVMIEEDQESEHYGEVTEISIEVVEADRQDGGRSGGDTDIEVSGIQVEAVEVQKIELQGDEARGDEEIGKIKGEENEGPKADVEGTGQTDGEKVGQLRRKVEQYYGLESGKVEIKYKVR